MKLRVGLIGLGADWESRHRPALRTLSDRFQVCAVFDQVRHRAEQAAADFEADSVSGYQRLVRRSDLDAVMILSPQWYGPLPIFAACDAGKAVYCAAALDMTPEQALQVKQ